MRIISLETGVSEDEGILFGPSCAFNLASTCSVGMTGLSTIGSYDIFSGTDFSSFTLISSFIGAFTYFSTSYRTSDSTI